MAKPNQNNKNSKNNKNNKNNTIPAGKRASVVVARATEDPKEMLSAMEETVMAHATEADLQAVETAQPPPPDTSSDELIRRASKLIKLLREQRTRLDNLESTLIQKQSELEFQRKELDSSREFVANGEKKLKADETALLGRQADILRRELDADAGFSRRNREALAQLEAEGEALRAQSSGHWEKMNTERTSFEQELKEERARLDKDAKAQRAQTAEAVAAMLATAESELTAQREELNEERKAIDDKTKQLQKMERDLAARTEMLNEDKKALDDRIAQKAAGEIERKDGELRACNERLEVARSERDRLAKSLAERQEADRRFGGETPDEVLKRMRELELEREQLRKALGGRPTAEATQRLEELERQKEQWESDKLKLLADLSEAKQEARRMRIAVIELESLRDEKHTLESSNAVLREASEQLRAEVGELVKGVEGKSPFPSCTQMDRDAALQSSHHQSDSIDDLKEFAEYVQHRMAWDPETGKKLYYSAEDVRSFIGGLAMSRLHLLQGISGTGKTSLPLAFARAIGADAKVIEVQAGWRDRQDLIGHFNTFERRFYESEFLQAIYLASTPRHRDTPFIIVLDEMNLSHPEQYFADLLSALEQDQTHQRLVLMTAPVDPAPALLIEGGTKIPIPPNVWFIGTANHDETTKDFADKTYDRAHVMELPRNRETFKRKDVRSKLPFSLEALQAAFADAAITRKQDAKTAYDFLQEKLGKTLEERFRVGWGNRLERQMGFYVPVVVAAGGSVGEATDHIVATKLLRKIRDRYDNRLEDIIELRDLIRTSWIDLDEKHKPLRSLALLQQELHRLGHDDV